MTEYGATARRREKVYEFIKEYIELHGQAPLRKEIEEALELSGNSVRTHVLKLVDEGRLSLSGNTRRPYRLKEQP